MDALMEQICSDRGLTDLETRALFCNPNYESGTHDPYLLVDMEKAVERLLSAQKKNEKVAIYSDFDCDGIPGAVVLHDGLTRLGFTDLEVYIPHRDKEGYGLHKHALKDLKERGVSLVITIDLGTVAYESAKYGKEIGLDIIITDHHELRYEDGAEVLPEAIAVINPKRGEYPYPHLCGAATIWKVTQALVGARRNEGLEVPLGWEKWLLDMVAIATIGDMVPLQGENRTLAHFGLKVLRKSPRPGLQALVRLAKARQEELTEDDIAFLFAPRINAASRMGSPLLAFRLLSTKDDSEAIRLAEELDDLNKERKSVVAHVAKEVRAKMKERVFDGGCLVMGSPDWKPSLLGLVSTNILDGKKGMVCMWGRDGEGSLKGSCRADGISVVEVFTRAKDSLKDYGGHHASGGFSVSDTSIHTLSESFQKAYQSILDEKKVKELMVSEGVIGSGDAISELQDESEKRYLLNHGLVGATFYKSLNQLAPFGMENKKPRFVLEGVVMSQKQFGKAKEHYEIVTESDGRQVKSICFFATPLSFTHTPEIGGRCKIIGNLERSTFGYKEEYRLRVEDVTL
jgi:single-stranded-DNA-specific exonuclease